MRAECIDVSLFVELLRTRPRRDVLGCGAGAGALWTLVPALFYAAPPGELPLVLAIGHEFQLGIAFGPPLAFWLAEDRLPHRRHVRRLSAVADLRASSPIGRCSRSAASSSARAHAVLAVLLMAGIAVFTVPTPEFGPAMLAMPLWALMLLHYWRAAGQERRIYWLALGSKPACLLLTTYAGLILIGLLLRFRIGQPARPRAVRHRSDPWIARRHRHRWCCFRHLIWLEQTNAARHRELRRPRGYRRQRMDAG